MKRKGLPKNVISLSDFCLFLVVGPLLFPLCSFPPDILVMISVSWQVSLLIRNTMIFLAWFSQVCCLCSLIINKHRSLLRHRWWMMAAWGQLYTSAHARLLTHTQTCIACVWWWSHRTNRDTVVCKYATHSRGALKLVFLIRPFCKLSWFYRSFNEDFQPFFHSTRDTKCWQESCMSRAQELSISQVTKPEISQFNSTVFI